MPTATKSTKPFRMECAIRCDIHAPLSTVWALLTDAERFPHWNSTVSRIAGNIALGQTLELEVPSAPGRTFKPKVTVLEAERAMQWSDGFGPMFKGVREFTLSKKSEEVTEFAMSEVFSGLMLPMIKSSLPDFAPIFETYAADLKRAAEGKK